MKKQVLFFQPYSYGHHPVYVFSILQNLTEKQKDSLIFFLVSENFLDIYAVDIASIKFLHNNVVFLSINQQEYQRWEGAKNIALKAILEWHIISDWAKKLEVTDVFLFFYDHLQLPLVISRRKRSFSLHGIYFHPNYHYDQLGFAAKDIKAKFLRIRKKFLFLFSIRNPVVKTILSLDPFFTEYIQEYLPHSMKCVYLPETTSIDNNVVVNKKVFYETWNIHAGQTVFLIFGVLSKRKGIFELLKSLECLSKEMAEKITILVVGKILPSDEQLLLSQIAHAKQNSVTQIVLHNREVSEAELNALFLGVDCVLALYKNHIGSSGVVVQSAAAHKPLIVSKWGLLGKTVIENKLGITVDVDDPVSIAKALELMIKVPAQCYSPSLMRKFTLRNNATVFSQTIFESLEIG